MSDTGWQLVVPSKFVVLAVLFLFPWIEVSCVDHTFGRNTREPMFTQSGWELAVGSGKGATLEDYRRRVEESRELIEEVQGGDVGNPIPQSTPAIVFGVATGCAIALGLILPLGTIRTIVLSGCVVSCLVALGILTTTDVPTVRELRDFPMVKLDIRVEFQPAFLVTWVLSSTSALVIGLEVWFRHRGPPTK